MDDWILGKKVFEALFSCALHPTGAVNCLNELNARAAQTYINSAIILPSKRDKLLKNALNKRLGSKLDGRFENL